MIATITLVMAAIIPGSPLPPPEPIDTSHVVAGWWSQYAQQPTDMMVAYHGFDWSDVTGYIAVPDCGRVGDYAYIRVNDGPWERVRVFDCMGDEGDISWWKQHNLIGEIDYYTALRYDVVGKGGVEAHLIWE